MSRFKGPARWLWVIGFTLSALAAIPAHALSGIWPLLNSAQRFTLYGPNQDLVFDRSTGLIWERSPSQETVAWHIAVDRCYNKLYPNNTTPGASRGWRLPTVEELASLQVFVRSIPHMGPSDYEFAPASDLFQNVSDAYWTVTTDPSSGILQNRDNAYVVRFGIQSSVNILMSMPKFRSPTDMKYWCVRGGSVPISPVQFESSI